MFANLVTTRADSPRRKRDKMNSYTRIQNGLSAVAGATGFGAIMFSIDYSQNLAIYGLTEWGYQTMPAIIATLWGVFAVSVVAKLWGAWVENRFWLKRNLAQKLETVADKLHPYNR